MTPRCLSEPETKESSSRANERPGKVTISQWEEASITMMFTALSHRSQKLVYFHPNNGIGNPLENKHWALKINQSPRAHKKFTHFCSVQFVLASKCSEAKSHKFRSQILTMSKLLHSCNDINFFIFRDLFLVKPTLGFKYFTNYFCITSPMKATNISSPENEII